MIISVSAAPIIDKSPEVRALAEKYGLTVYQDPMRAACDGYGFQTIYDMPASLQTEVRKSLIASHQQFLTDHSDALLNYSVVEWLADWMRWGWNTVPTEAWAEVMSAAKSSAGRYDQIYHVEKDGRRPYDGYAWLDQKNSDQINRLMKYLYDELQVTGKINSATAV